MAIITGTNASETLPGTAGKDTITGGFGDDLALMAGGNDVFVWNSGDGNDTIEGGAGLDILQFNASAGAETMEISADGARARLTRNVGTVVMDLDDVERIELAALGGTDTITVQDLTGTDVKQVAINLGSDGEVDAVTLNGNAGNNTISVTLAGAAVTVAGLPAQATITGADATDSLVINGLGGNDTINAAKLPAGVLALTLDGGDGNDKITGSLGNDVLFGGAGNDTVAGDDGKDAAFLGAGDDLFVWNPGDGNDTVTGGTGIDTFRFTGSSAQEFISVHSIGGGMAGMSRQAGSDLNILDLSQIERVEVRALAGADTVQVGELTGLGISRVDIDLAATAGGKTADTSVDTVNVFGTLGNDLVDVGWSDGKIVTTGLAAAVTIAHAGAKDILSLDTTDGDDVIVAASLAAGKMAVQVLAGAGNDTIFGSAGSDTVTGGAGSDRALLGAGNDQFVWNPGDDNDTVEGQGGADTFVAASVGNVSEFIDIEANGERARFTLDGSIVDLNDVERTEYQAREGEDIVTVWDMAGSDVTEVVIDLSGSGGGGDGWIDNLAQMGGAANDTIIAAMVGAAVSVTGMSAKLAVTGADTFDALSIFGLGGDDRIDGSKMPASTMMLFLVGGAGNDTLVGGAAWDSLFGGDHNDVISGGGGRDVAQLGSGDDLFLWNAGDGNDVVEGQGGFDTLRFTGSKDNETFDISANGTRTQLLRDLAAVNMDINDVERLEVRTLGGADSVVVNDLTGTDVTEVAIDLAAAAGGKAADGKIDTVTVHGTAGADAVTVTASGSTIVVAGLAAQVSIDHADKTDRLAVNGGDDADVIDASSLAARKIVLTINGGGGADDLRGSAGNDLFIWNPGDGDDTVKGGAGNDTLRFNGDDVDEAFDIDPNGGHIAFSRDVDSVLLDLDDVERIELNALGGTDAVEIGDLTGTDVKQVAIDLAGDGGDGEIDTVLTLGTAGNDSIKVSLVGGVVTVTGLAAQVSIAHAELANDELTIIAQGGNDKISASALPASTLQLVLDGGAGNDTITGNAGNNLLSGGTDNDVLNGGAGNDLLFGGDGIDKLDGGTGNDTVAGGAGNDTVTVSAGNDTVRYLSVLDGHDVITGFDGNAAGGQDVFDLDALFDDLGVAAVNRAGRVSTTDNGATVDIFVDADGGAGFELAVATLKTADVITVGQDILVGA